MKKSEFYYIFVYPVILSQLYRVRSVDCKDGYGFLFCKDAKEDA